MIQTFRDAEIEIRRLQDAISSIGKSLKVLQLSESSKKAESPPATASMPDNFIEGNIPGNGGVVLGSGPNKIKESNFIYGGEYYLSIGTSSIPTLLNQGNLLYLLNDKNTATGEDNAIIRVDSLHRNAVFQARGIVSTSYAFHDAAGGSKFADIAVFNSDGALRFNTAGSERCRITSGGTFLYGTTTDDGVNMVQINGKVKIFDTLTLVNELTVANGGTGRKTLTANYTLMGDGTNQVKLVNGYNHTYTHLYDIAIVTNTIQYKDWASANQSMVVVTDVIKTTKDFTFTYGVLTGIV